jgi:hypothetical protein
LSDPSPAYDFDAVGESVRELCIFMLKIGKVSCLSPTGFTRNALDLVRRLKLTIRENLKLDFAVEVLQRVRTTRRSATIRRPLIRPSPAAAGAVFKRTVMNHQPAYFKESPDGWR